VKNTSEDIEMIPAFDADNNEDPSDNHIIGTCPKVSDENHKRFIAIIKKRPTKSSFVFDPRKTRECKVKWCISAEVAFNKFQVLNIDNSRHTACIYLHILESPYSCLFLCQAVSMKDEMKNKL
jgi:hypothetical protein